MIVCSGLVAYMSQYGCQHKWKKNQHQMKMDYSIHNVSFLNFIAPTVSENYRTLFIQTIFMYNVGKRE